MGRFRTESDSMNNKRNKNSENSSESSEDDMLTFEEFLGLEVTNRNVSISIYSTDFFM